MPGESYRKRFGSLIVVVRLVLRILSANELPCVDSNWTVLLGLSHNWTVLLGLSQRNKWWEREDKGSKWTQCGSRSGRVLPPCTSLHGHGTGPEEPSSVPCTRKHTHKEPSSVPYTRQHGHKEPQNNGSVKAVFPRHCPVTFALRNCCFNCCAGQSH